MHIPLFQNIPVEKIIICTKIEKKKLQRIQILNKTLPLYVSKMLVFYIQIDEKKMHTERIQICSRGINKLDVTLEWVYCIIVMKKTVINK